MEKVRVPSKSKVLAVRMMIKRIKKAKSDNISKDNSKNEDIDIDAMFDDFKKKKKEKALIEAERKKEEEKNPKRKFTEDGLPIFTEDELKINNPKAGTTPLCPFECDCCF